LRQQVTLTVSNKGYFLLENTLCNHLRKDIITKNFDEMDGIVDLIIFFVDLVITPE